MQLSCMGKNLMETDLFKQLDLAIYAQNEMHWWQHPLLQIVLVMVLVGIVGSVIWFVRKRRKKEENSHVQLLLDVLYQSVRLWEQKKLATLDLLLILTSLIKQYTGFCVKNQAIVGMTDQEWLKYVQTVDIFKPVYAECMQMVTLLSQYKFHDGDHKPDGVSRLCELVYQIIARTASGTVAATSGVCVHN